MSELVVELLAEELTAEELVKRAQHEIQDLKQHRDPETTALRMAALVQAAALRLRHMEESHAEHSSGRLDHGCGGDGGGPRGSDPEQSPGGRWIPPGAARRPKTSLRPH